MNERPAISVWQRLLRNPRVVIGGGVCALLLLLAVCAPWIAPLDPQEQDLLSSFEAPALFGAPADAAADSPRHWLGTDNLGRDVLSRLVFGTRTALLVAVIAATLAALIGSALGALAGFYGGRVDALISRLVDVWMSFPPVLLAIVLVSVGTFFFAEQPWPDQHQPGGTAQNLVAIDFDRRGSVAVFHQSQRKKISLFCL